MLAPAMLLGCLAAGPVLAADLPVDVELILAVDVSGSVDAVEADLQRAGYVSALSHPQVIGAITSGFHGRIAVAYVEWADALIQTTVLDWQLIDSPESAKRVADTLAEAPITRGLYTSISAAIDYGLPMFDENGYAGVRRIIDISGDGVNNRGRPAAEARDAALAAGVTINGLPIINDRPNPFGVNTPKDLDRYYEREVIGGSEAFVLVAQGFETFGEAILSKLLREIAGRAAEPGHAASVARHME